jgi:hypothetical protein
MNILDIKVKNLGRFKGGTVKVRLFLKNQQDNSQI